jgi:hypothetical protein
LLVCENDCANRVDAWTSKSDVNGTLIRAVIPVSAATEAKESGSAA